MLSGKNLKENNKKIHSVGVGDLVWQIYGLAEITRISGRGISAFDGAAYVCYHTKFGKSGGSMSGSLRADRLMEKDGYFANEYDLQFIKNQKVSDFKKIN